MPRPKKYPDRPPGHINVAEVCRVLEISRATLYRYRDSEDFPSSIEADGHAWFDEATVRLWAERRSGHPLITPWITSREKP